MANALCSISTSTVLQVYQALLTAALVASLNSPSLPVLGRRSTTRIGKVGACVACVGVSVEVKTVGASLVGTLLTDDNVGASVGDSLVGGSVGICDGTSVVARDVGGMLLGARVTGVVGISVASPGVLSAVRLVGVEVVVSFFGLELLSGIPVPAIVAFVCSAGAGDNVLLLGSGAESTSRGTVTHSPGTPTQNTGTSTGHCREALCCCTDASVGHSKASIGGTSTGQSGGSRLRGSYASIVMPLLPPATTAL